MKIFSRVTFPVYGHVAVILEYSVVNSLLDSCTVDACSCNDEATLLCHGYYIHVASYANLHSFCLVS